MATETDATLWGQLLIFIGLLVKSALDFWKERQASKERSEIRRESAEREQRLKKEMHTAAQKAAGEVGVRLDALKKRFNGLLETEELPKHHE